MQVTISSRHMDVSAALREYAEQKASKLNRFYDRLKGAEVIFDNAKQEIQVEVIATAEGHHTFVAKQNGADVYACIDECIEKMERQLSDYKKKFRNRKHALGRDKRVVRRTGS